MSKKSITIKDIANRLNISVATVSRALRNSAEIKKETKLSVLKMAKEMDYHPNLLASSLSSKKSKILGVVVPTINRQFWSNAISGIENIAYQEGYKVMIFQSAESYRKEVEIVETLANSRVDGILMAFSQETIVFSHIQHVMDRGIPVLLFERVCEELHTSKIVTDNYKGAKKIVQHLLDQGYKNIAYLAGPLSLNVCKERYQGYRDTLFENGLTVPEGLVIEIPEFSYENAANAWRFLWGARNRPDAVFCFADILAIGVLHAVGGLWAVVVTDVLQFVVLTAAVLIVVPLSVLEVNGFGQFMAQAPEDFFQLVNGEYTWTFIIAFGIYNLVFIGGNWAYVQRYTSTKDSGSASKVGYLFGILYLVSPIIWMLPPMIYQVIAPGLNTLDAEGAFLLMCQRVLPVGTIGLMLGGMIFATASSVNTSLNLAAAVLTNDIYKPLRPYSTDKNLMLVARLTTILFGVGTIGVAFMVPMAGGIVEVVLSIGAVTGGALYGPAIWALFSKRQDGQSILWVTGISLLVNLFFKFMAPVWLDFTFGRSMEMLVGVGVPFLLLFFYEIYGFFMNESILPHNQMPEQGDEQLGLIQVQNLYGIKVLGLAFGAIGLVFLTLTLWAQQAASYLAIAGILVILLGGYLYVYATRTSHENTPSIFKKNDKQQLIK